MSEAFTTLPKTGYTRNTPRSFVLNAGAVIKNLVWSGGQWRGERLGATSGGNSLTLTQEIEQIEVDGVFGGARGLDIITESEASLTCNVIELTAENIRTAIRGRSFASNGTNYPTGYTVIEPKGQIEDSDYLQNIAYVGSVAGSDRPIIVILHNAICTSGLELENTDGEKGTVEMVFEGRVDAENVENQALPVTILYPTLNITAAAAQIQVNALKGATPNGN
ncbi:MAG: hypothetical protein FWF59_08495 [Turicibacter sp.]|nr:hypothetical protein [Turicibacter sp.]